MINVIAYSIGKKDQAANSSDDLVSPPQLAIGK
jgi:hypothetical protein